MSSEPRLTMQAIRTTGNQDAPLALRQVAAPQPTADETLVAVHAISLNRGEVSYAGGRPAEQPIGWDFAGVVEQAAANGDGPAAGTRVVGFVWRGAWAELVAAPANQVAAIPAALSFEDAASLPVAAGTALQALRIGNYEQRQAILITGASGGVGRFAVQLAAMTNATVTGTAGHPDRAAGLADLGADTIIIGDAPFPATYDLMVDMVGGGLLERALPHLTDDAPVVKVGNASGAETVNDPRVQQMRLSTETIAADLTYLAQQVVAGALQTSIAHVADWTTYADAAAMLMERQINGKAVLRVR